MSLKKMISPVDVEQGKLVSESNVYSHLIILLIIC